MLISVNGKHLVEVELSLPNPLIGDEVCVIDIHSVLDSPQSELQVRGWLLGNCYQVKEITQHPMGKTYSLN